MSKHIKRIAIVGPECTGKTSLSIALATHYQTLWVPEYAREYLDRLNQPYTQLDLLPIAKGQLNAEDTLVQQATRVLICDTNLIVIKIWSDFKYGNCDPEILKLLHQRHYDLYLLTQTDIPWENDPQREHPNLRKELFTIYKKELETLKTPYVEISGDVHSRLASSIQAIDRLSSEEIQ